MSDKVTFLQDEEGKRITKIEHQGFFGPEEVLLDESGKVIASHEVGAHVGVEIASTLRISNLTQAETQFHAGKVHDKKCPPGCQNHCCIETYMLPNQVKIELRKISCIAHCACERCSIKLCPEQCECHLCVGEPICRRKCSCTTCQISASQVSLLAQHCSAGCHCETCLAMGYTLRARDVKWNEVLWQGLVAVEPDTPQYRIMKCSLTHEIFYDLNLKNPLHQIKFLLDGNLGLPMIKVTHQGQSYAAFYVANSNVIVQLCSSLFRAHIIAEVADLWFPHRHFTGYISGTLMKKSAFHKKFHPVIVTIDKQGLYQQGQLVEHSTNEVWSHFQMKKIYGHAYLQLKIWNGLAKEAYWIPIKEVTAWLEAFFELILKNSLYKSKPFVYF